MVENTELENVSKEDLVAAIEKRVAETNEQQRLNGMLETPLVKLYGKRTRLETALTDLKVGSLTHKRALEKIGKLNRKIEKFSKPRGVKRRHTH